MDMKQALPGSDPRNMRMGSCFSCWDCNQRACRCDLDMRCRSRPWPTWNCLYIARSF